MNIDMLPLEIIGMKTDLPAVVSTLRLLGCVQIDSLADFPTVSARPLALDRDTLQKQEDMNFLVARLEGLLDTLRYPEPSRTTSLPEDFLAQARLELVVCQT
jgi:hypothetical protein